MENIIKNTAAYEALLDSDDEFPSEYFENPTLPAYKLENRFDKINFKWIVDQNLLIQDKKNVSGTNQADNMTHDEKHSNTKLNDKMIIKSGVLSKNDLYCLKAIEKCADDCIFIWLVNFMIYKDVRSSYAFLKSCLVSTNIHDKKYKFINKSSSSTSPVTERLYKLLIKT